MKKRLIMCWLVLWTMAFGLPGAQVWCQNVTVEAQDILIRFQDALVTSNENGTVVLDAATRDQVESLGLCLRRWYPSARVYRAQLPPERSMAEVLDVLRRHRGVVYAEPNYLRYPLAVVPNDPRFGEQWALERIGMPEAWTITTGNPETLLAVADTGLDTAHEDLVGNLWKNPGEVCGNGKDDDADGYVDNCYSINTVEGSGDVFDSDGHGTSMAGIAAATGNNAVGMAGVTWRAAVMPMKMIGPFGGTVADFLEALEFAQARGVRVMNLSFGSYSYSQAERDALASSGDILFVAAAGNDGSNNDLRPLYPAGYSLPNLIAVAASDELDHRAPFSNYGRCSVHLAAPGTNILGPVPGNRYRSGSGTSQATAVVSGAAALVLGAYPALNPPEIKERLLRTVDVPYPPLPVITGGRVNVHRALTAEIAGPFIYRIVPAAAPVGAWVSIYGASFLDIPGAVLFSDGVAGEVLSWSNEEITVRVPEGAVSGPVTVETAEGVSLGVQFTVRERLTWLWRWLGRWKAMADGTGAVVLFNPLPHTTWVTVALMDTTRGGVTLKHLVLAPLEKQSLNREEIFPAQPPLELMVGVFSASEVSATVVNPAPENLPDVGNAP